MSDAVPANIRHQASGTAPLASASYATVTWAITAAIALALVALIVGAPLAQANAHPVFASSIYKVFSFVCHQIPERSFHLAGHRFAVCSRCTGLYTGFAAVALVYPLAHSLTRTDATRRRWLILAAVPLLIDFSLTYFDLWSNTHLTRFATGALLGAVSVFYVMPAAIELAGTVGQKFAGEAKEKSN